jgi:bifunctional DNase/RNase
MVVESVRVHMLSSQHVVILREANSERYLPIWIGSWEAQSIAMRLQGVEAERPLTHDLLATVLDDLSVSVRQVVVSDLSDETFRARIVLVQGGSDHEIDARPSDAIALAVRVSAPIFATEAVLDRAGVIPETEQEEKLSVFREFVNSLEGDPEREGGGPGGGSGAAGPGDPSDRDERPLDDRLGDEPGGPPPA